MGETVVVHLVADASRFLAGLDYATSRLIGYTAGLASSITRHGAMMAVAFEKNTVAVQTMVKDLATGTKLVEDLTNLAIETPFSSQELVESAKQLKAFGFDTQDLISTLRSLGDVSSGTGTSMERIILAFGQVRVAGKLMGTELRQFVDAGIPLIETLAKVMNKPVESIRLLVEQGQVGFNEVVLAFNQMTGSGGIFANLMDRISKETVAGRWQAFSEVIEVTARNFALAAADGLGLKDTLTKMSDGLQGFVKDKDQKATVEVFQNIKIALNGVLMVVNQVVIPLRQAFEWTRKWVVENKEALRYVLLAVAGVWGLYAAIKVVTVALILVRTVLFGIAALSGILSVISSIGTLYGVVSGLVGLVAAFAPFVILFGGLIGLLTVFQGFRFSGGGFAELGKQLSGVTDSFKLMTEYLQEGNLDKAFEVAIRGLRILFRSLMLTIKAEFFALLEGLELGFGEFGRGIQLIGSKLWANVRSGFAGLNPFKSQEMVDKEREGIWKSYAEKMGQIVEQSKAATQEVVNAQKGYAKRLFEGDEILRRLNAETAAAVAQRESERKNQAGQAFVTENLKMLQQVQAELRDVFEKMPKADRVIIGQDMDRRLNRETGMRDDEFLFPIQGLKRLAKEGNANLIEIGQGLDGFLGVDGIMTRLSKTAQQFIRDMNAAYGLQTGGASIRIPNPFLQQASVGMLFSQMAAPYGISGKARDVLNELAKEMGKGVTSWEQEVIRLRAVNEAYFGSAMGNNIAAAAGGLALAGRMGGPLGQAAKEYEDFQRIMRMQKASGAMEFKPPPTAMAGTQAAQDIINANLSQQVSVEQEILSVLISSKTESQEQTKLQKAMAEAWDRLSKQGVIKAIGME